MAGDMIRIRTGAEMRSCIGSRTEDVIEIPRAEWEALTEAERDQRLNEIAEETVSNEVDAWAYVDEEG